MTESIKTQGLLLQSIPYLGQKKILKILTPEQGLISLFTNKTKLSPFCLAEFVYLKTNKELHTLQDASLIDPFLHLRSDYDTLLQAGNIAQDLLRTQMPGKRSPFSLACAYLQKLSLNPQILSASFRLKLLIHEGLFSHEPDPSFTPEEWEQVAHLALARQFSSLQALTTAPFRKIELFFERLIEEC